MNITTVIGIILIVLGVVGLIYGGINYTTSKDVVDMGSMHLQVDQHKRIPLSPSVGTAAVTVEFMLVLAGRRWQTGGSAR